GAKQSWGEDGPKYLVIPAQAKIQWLQSFASKMLGSRVRGNDEQRQGLPRGQGKTPALLPAFFVGWCGWIGGRYRRSKRSSSMTLLQAAAKSLTIFSPASLWA